MSWISKPAYLRLSRRPVCIDPRDFTVLDCIELLLAWCFTRLRNKFAFDKSLCILLRKERFDYTLVSYQQHSCRLGHTLSALLACDLSKALIPCIVHARLFSNFYSIVLFFCRAFSLLASNRYRRMWRFWSRGFAGSGLRHLKKPAFIKTLAKS